MSFEIFFLTWPHRRFCLLENLHTNLSFASNDVLSIEQNLNQHLKNANDWLFAKKLILTNLKRSLC